MCLYLEVYVFFVFLRVFWFFKISEVTHQTSLQFFAQEAAIRDKTQLYPQNKYKIDQIKVRNDCIMLLKAESISQLIACQEMNRQPFERRLIIFHLSRIIADVTQLQLILGDSDGHDKISKTCIAIYNLTWTPLAVCKCLI